MIEWSKYSQLPTEATLNTYPTILEILKDIVAQEEEEQINKSPLKRHIEGSFYDWSRVGHYIFTSEEYSGRPTLMPTSRTPWTYYRGQNKYYDQCLPSLYRESELIEKETLKSHLHTIEMILVMQTHPIIKFLKEIGVCHKSIGIIHLPIIYDGLAQHYGIKTHYLDITNDIWTAVFFASTTANNDIYTPVTITENSLFAERYGVLYRFDYMSTYECENPCNNKIIPIGLQYFNRPGRQCGFVMDMQNTRNFHDVHSLERIYFRHDNDANQLIFTLSQFGKQYFPNDSFADVVKTICKSGKVSIDTVKRTYKEYYSTIPFDDFVRDVREVFEITSGLNASFPKDLIEQEVYEWNHGGAERYKRDIIITPVEKFCYNS